VVVANKEILFFKSSYIGKEASSISGKYWLIYFLKPGTISELQINTLSGIKLLNCNNGVYSSWYISIVLLVVSGFFDSENINSLGLPFNNFVEVSVASPN